MERRQLTLMFTDIVGYSKLMGQNESQTIKLVDEYRRILLARIEEFEGRVVEFIGDAVFASFDLPSNAVNAATAIQNDLQLFNDKALSNRPLLRTRIGLHMGEVTEKEGSLFGDDVNIAARLEPVAVADGVCVSEAVYLAVKGELKFPVKNLGELPLKNIESRVKAYLIRPAGVTAATHIHYALRTFQQKIQAYRYPLAIALVALVAAGFYLIPRWLVPGYTANYVEIADFKNLMSEEGKADYFSAGITEALRSQLADMEDVYILDPSKGVRGPVRLEGSVQKIGESLRIAYRLFRRKDNVQIAGGKLDGAYKDIFILQDRIVAEIGRYIAKEFNLKFFRPAQVNFTSDLTAYEYFLKGMEYLHQQETHVNLDEAIKYFTTSLVHDEKFSQANGGICRAYRDKFQLSQNVDMLKKASDYCEKALSQDDKNTNFHLAMGAVKFDMGDFQSAAKYFDKSLRLDSNNVEAQVFKAIITEKKNQLDRAEEEFKRLVLSFSDYWFVYSEYANFLASIGRFDEAIELLKKSLRVTPENEIVLSNLGTYYLYLGDFSSAAESFARATDINATSAGYSNAGSGYYFSQNYAKAAQFFKKAIQLSPNDYRLYLNLADATRQLKPADEEAYVYYKASVGLAKKLLDIDPRNPTVNQYMAICYLHLKKIEKAESAMSIAISSGKVDVELMYAQVRYWVLVGDYKNASSVLGELLLLGFSKELIELDPDFKNFVKSERYRELVLS